MGLRVSTGNSVSVSAGNLADILFVFPGGKEDWKPLFRKTSLIPAFGGNFLEGKLPELIFPVHVFR